MRNFARYLAEASFSPKNFPSEFGNDEFSGAGERTPYVPLSADGEYKHDKGFPLNGDALLVSLGDDENRVLDAGTLVYFTYPAKLYRSEDIGVSRKSTWAKVSLKGWREKADGYIPISKVEKPSGNAQQRVNHGAAAQKTVNEYIQERAKKLGLMYEFVSTAPPGSTIPDLVVKLDGRNQQFEIKGASSQTAPITLFDKSARRESYDPWLDDLTDVFIDNLPGLKEGLTANNYSKTFAGVMDYYQNEVDPKIGFAGDEGVIKSGRLPGDFRTEDPEILKPMLQEIKDHFAEGGDNYFVVYNRTVGEFRLFHTGFGQNLLKAPKLPPLKKFELSTYGGASSGSTRVGVKVKL